jgi:acyl-CoA synthetase (NDP forming)
LTTAEQAEKLSTLWHRLSTQHIALGCACNMAGLSVTLEDFERDIADYLWAESQRFGKTEVEKFLLEPGPISEQPRAIRSILQRLEHDATSQEVAQWLLQRMTKTIESYALLHGPSVVEPLLRNSGRWGNGYRH